MASGALIASKPVTVLPSNTVAGVDDVQTSAPMPADAARSVELRATSMSSSTEPCNTTANGVGDTCPGRDTLSPTSPSPKGGGASPSPVKQNVDDASQVSAPSRSRCFSPSTSRSRSPSPRGRPLESANNTSSPLPPIAIAVSAPTSPQMSGKKRKASHLNGHDVPRRHRHRSLGQSISPSSSPSPPRVLQRRSVHVDVLQRRGKLSGGGSGGGELPSPRSSSTLESGEIRVSSSTQRVRTALSGTTGSPGVLIASTSKTSDSVVAQATDSASVVHPPPPSPSPPPPPSTLPSPSSALLSPSSTLPSPSSTLPPHSAMLPPQGLLALQDDHPETPRSFRPNLSLARDGVHSKKSVLSMLQPFMDKAKRSVAVPSTTQPSSTRTRTRKRSFSPDTDDSDANGGGNRTRAKQTVSPSPSPPLPPTSRHASRLRSRSRSRSTIPSRSSSESRSRSRVRSRSRSRRRRSRSNMRSRSRSRRRKSRSNMRLRSRSRSRRKYRSRSVSVSSSDSEEVSPRRTKRRRRGSRSSKLGKKRRRSKKKRHTARKRSDASLRGKMRTSRKSSSFSRSKSRSPSRRREHKRLRRTSNGSTPNGSPKCAHSSPPVADSQENCVQVNSGAGAPDATTAAGVPDEQPAAASKRTPRPRARRPSAAPTAESGQQSSATPAASPVTETSEGRPQNSVPSASILVTVPPKVAKTPPPRVRPKTLRSRAAYAAQNVSRTSTSPGSSSSAAAGRSMPTSSQLPNGASLAEKFASLSSEKPASSAVPLSSGSTSSNTDIGTIPQDANLKPKPHTLRSRASYAAQNATGIVNTNSASSNDASSDSSDVNTRQVVGNGARRIGGPMQVLLPPLHKVSGVTNRLDASSTGPSPSPDNAGVGGDLCSDDTQLGFALPFVSQAVLDEPSTSCTQGDRKEIGSIPHSTPPPSALEHDPSHVYCKFHFEYMGETHVYTKLVPLVEFHKQYGFPFSNVPFPRELEGLDTSSSISTRAPAQSPLSARPTARKRRKASTAQFFAPIIPGSFGAAMPEPQTGGVQPEPVDGVSRIKEEPLTHDPNPDPDRSSSSHAGISSETEAHFQSILRELRKNAGSVPRHLIDTCVRQLREAGRHELADEMMLAVEIDALPCGEDAMVDVGDSEKPPAIEAPDAELRMPFAPPQRPVAARSGGFGGTAEYRENEDGSICSSLAATDAVGGGTAPGVMVPSPRPLPMAVPVLPHMVPLPPSRGGTRGESMPDVFTLQGASSGVQRSSAQTQTLNTAHKTSPQLLNNAPSPAGAVLSAFSQSNVFPPSTTHAPVNTHAPSSPGVLITPAPSIVVTRTPGTLPTPAPAPGILLTNAPAPSTLTISTPPPGTFPISTLPPGALPTSAPAPVTQPTTVRARGSQYSYQAPGTTPERPKRPRASPPSAASSSRVKPIPENEVRAFEKKIYHEADPEVKLKRFRRWVEHFHRDNYARVVSLIRKMISCKHAYDTQAEVARIVRENIAKFNQRERFVFISKTVKLEQKLGLHPIVDKNNEALPIISLKKATKLDYNEAMTKIKVFLKRQHTASQAQHLVGEEKEAALPESFEIPLMDPVTHERIKVPVRSTRCLHVDCIDFATHFQKRSSSSSSSGFVESLGVRSYRCPICEVPILADDLVIDGFLSNVLGCQKAQDNHKHKVVKISFGASPQWDLKDDFSGGPLQEDSRVPVARPDGGGPPSVLFRAPPPTLQRSSKRDRHKKTKQLAPSYVPRPRSG